MGRIVSVRLWSLNDEPLIADVETDEAEPYRRTTVGFMSPRAREIYRGDVGRSRDVGPLDESDEEEDEAIGLEVEIAEEEEDEP